MLEAALSDVPGRLDQLDFSALLSIVQTLNRLILPILTYDYLAGLCHY